MKKLLMIVPALLLALGFASCDKCKKADCQNDATCEKKEGKCNCSTFFEGEKCETELRKKYYGKFIGNVELNGAQIPVPVTVSAYGSEANKLTAVVDLTGGSATLVCTLSNATDYTTNEVTTTITNPADGKPLEVKVSGTGTISATSLTSNLLIKGDFARQGVEIPAVGKYSGTK